MNKESINQRFKNAITDILDTKKAKTKTEIASSIGIKYGNLAEILSNRMNANADVIASLCNIYSISSEFLLLGIGDMYQKSTNITACQSDILKTKETSKYIPLIPIEAVAGWNGIDTPGVTLIDCQCYQIPDFISAGAEYLIRVSGSSMYPKYSSGDILACKKIHEITFFQWGKIYVIDSAQGTMVKRLFECPNQPNNIICKSDNEKYPPFELPKAEIRSLSIVIGVVRLE